MKKFLFGLITGIVLTGIFESVAYLVLGEAFWSSPKTFFGYHFHHSLLGLIILLAGLILVFRKNHKAYFYIGLGVGIIIIHTITDGRLIFIEKLLS